MPDDDNQDQNAQNNNDDQSGHVDAPDNSASGGLASFTMDPSSHDDNPAAVPDSSTALPAEPLGPPAAADEPEATEPTPDQPVDNPALPPDDAPATDTDEDLANIKQQALSQLSPIVSHLDQTPEEKFKTLMMMIQAADDQTLIKDAYAAAQDIPDEKLKAQALLDVVNEINYFTQSKED